jgi:hypothetical protein
MPASVHVNRRLTNLSLMFPSNFDSIGDQFFLPFAVDHLSDQFVTYNKANQLSLRDLTPLGDDDTPPSVQLKWDADTTFNCQIYGVSSPGKWVTSGNADPSLDYEAQRAIQLTESLRLRLEYLKVNQKLRSTAVMTSNATLSAAERFDNWTSSSCAPVEYLKRIVTLLGYANGGKRPNRMAMTSFVLNAIAGSEDYKDRVKYTVLPNGTSGPDAPRGNEGQLALLETMIGVVPGTIKIADHVYNSAQEGQTAAYKTFLGSDIPMGYVEQMGLRKWSMSAQFQWSVYANTPTAIISVPQYNRGTVVTEEFRAFTVIDAKVIKPELGYLIKGCVNTADSKYNSLLD